jgi:mannose-6-phosphate isomerase-like protein (cupin superfamily)
MNLIGKVCLLSITGLFCLAAATASAQTKPRPLTKPLECAQVDCLMLSGVPESAGMRSGFVRLKPGQSVGSHSTGRNEETLVVLHGKGTARIEGQEGLPFEAPALVYIPSGTHHNVENTGEETLEYEYVVAPVQAP